MSYVVGTGVGVEGGGDGGGGVGVDGGGAGVEAIGAPPPPPHPASRTNGSDTPANMVFRMDMFVPKTRAVQRLSYLMVERSLTSSSIQSMNYAMTPQLAHIDAWIFDLDNTLYPAKADLFALIDARMTAYVSRLLDLPHDEARAVQKRYFAEHGTTMRGLMDNHGVEAAHFLDDVHDIELDRVTEDRRLVAQIAALPGRKLVFTNGDAAYASRVLERLGLAASFEGVHDIHAMGLIPKPDASAYAGLCARWGIAPESALFVDDMARNLAPAKALGMTTVWLDNGSEQAGGSACPSYVDLRIEDLASWLEQVLEEA